MRRKELIREYRKNALQGVKIVDMSPTSLAGYYLHTYPGNPEGALVIDIGNTLIPSTVAVAAEIIIKSI